MKAQTLPAVAGWRWLIGGFVIFRRNPPALAMLVVSYWLTVLMLKALAAFVPVLGAVVVSLIIPGLSVGVMQACHDLENGKAIGLPTLFGGIKKNPRTLMALGIFNLVAMLVVVGLVALADGGEFYKVLMSREPPSEEVFASGALLWPASVAMLLMLPFFMANWYAPMLAAWHSLPVFKALFFSLVSCWINWRAFCIYTLAVFACGIVAPSLILGPLSLVIPGAEPFLVALMALIVGPILFGSFYVSYRDVFVRNISERV